MATSDVYTQRIKLKTEHLRKDLKNGLEYIYIDIYK